MPDRLVYLDSSALAFGEDLGAIVVYDLALAGAARAAGLTVLAPA